MALTAEAPFTIWANPAPLLVSRQAVFPGLVRLDDGTLIAMFAIGQAFDAADQRMYVSRSSDGGASWSEPAPVPQVNDLDMPESETLKPLVLGDGTLIATGYGFARRDPLTPIVDSASGALLPMRNKISRSHDGGLTWSPSRAFSVEGAALELSGPCIALPDGAVLGAAAPFHLGAGDQEGWLIRSDDAGRTWHRQSVFHRTENGHIAPWECRLAWLGGERIAVLFWAYDTRGECNLPNHLALSGDGGDTFTTIDTGIAAQASNLMPLGTDRLLTIHCHREAPVSLTARIVTIDGGQIQVEAKCALLEGARAIEATDAAGQFASLSFGQPGLVRLDEATFLAAWWQVENRQHVIKGCRLRLDGLRDHR